ncbi:hypothetical protein COOONC_23578 [Cooperia oncophora]
MGEYGTEAWFEFTFEDIVPWWRIGLPINMAAAVMVLCGFLYVLLHRKVQVEETVATRRIDIVETVKWHLEEELKKEAKKFLQREELRHIRRREKATMSMTHSESEKRKQDKEKSPKKGSKKESKETPKKGKESAAAVDKESHEKVSKEKEAPQRSPTPEEKLLMEWRNSREKVKDVQENKSKDDAHEI